MCGTVQNEIVAGWCSVWTLRTQDISALCVWCRSVSHICTGAKVSISDSWAHKCMRHFGSRIKRCFECHHCVKKCRPTLYSLL